MAVGEERSTVVANPLGPSCFQVGGHQILSSSCVHWLGGSTRGKAAAGCVVLGSLSIPDPPQSTSSIRRRGQWKEGHLGSEELDSVSLLQCLLTAWPLAHPLTSLSLRLFVDKLRVIPILGFPFSQDSFKDQ